MSVLFEDLESRKVYVFAVVSINRRGHPSAPSNPVQVFWDYPPQQPTAVRGEPGDKRVDLSWDPVIDATGYNVYRKEEGASYPLTPLNREPLRATQYRDLGVENEKKYYYSVRALRRVVKTDVEGKGSSDLAMIPTDLIPPTAPTGLVVVAVKEGVELTWIKNKEPDLSGYNVYRRKVGEQGYTKLNDLPVPKETYLDRSAEVDQEYDYVVTAVDKSPRGNESPYSEETRIKYIY
jgi:fibronectin type 3 domain-containing protein